MPLLDDELDSMGENSDHKEYEELSLLASPSPSISPSLNSSKSGACKTLWFVFGIGLGIIFILIGICGLGTIGVLRSTVQIAVLEVNPEGICKADEIPFHVGLKLENPAWYPIKVNHFKFSLMSFKNESGIVVLEDKTNLVDLDLSPTFNDKSSKTLHPGENFMRLSSGLKMKNPQLVGEMTQQWIDGSLENVEAQISTSISLYFFGFPIPFPLKLKRNIVKFSTDLIPGFKFMKFSIIPPDIAFKIKDVEMESSEKILGKFSIEVQSGPNLNLNLNFPELKLIVTHQDLSIVDFGMDKFSVRSENQSQISFSLKSITTKDLSTADVEKLQSGFLGLMNNENLSVIVEAKDDGSMCVSNQFTRGLRKLNIDNNIYGLLKQSESTLNFLKDELPKYPFAKHLVERIMNQTVGNISMTTPECVIHSFSINPESDIVLKNEFFFEIRNANFPIVSNFEPLRFKVMESNSNHDDESVLMSISTDVFVAGDRRFSIQNELNFGSWKKIQPLMSRVLSEGANVFSNSKVILESDSSISNGTKNLLSTLMSKYRIPVLGHTGSASRSLFSSLPFSKDYSIENIVKKIVIKSSTPEQYSKHEALQYTFEISAHDLLLNRLSDIPFLNYFPDVKLGMSDVNATIYYSERYNDWNNVSTAGYIQGKGCKILLTKNETKASLNKIKIISTFILTIEKAKTFSKVMSAVFFSQGIGSMFILGEKENSSTQLQIRLSGSSPLERTKITFALNSANITNASFEVTSTGKEIILPCIFLRGIACPENVDYADVGYTDPLVNILSRTIISSGSRTLPFPVHFDFSQHSLITDLGILDLHEFAYLEVAGSNWDNMISKGLKTTYVKTLFRAMVNPVGFAHSVDGLIRSKLVETGFQNITVIARPNSLNNLHSAIMSNFDLVWPVLINGEIPNYSPNSLAPLWNLDHELITTSQNGVKIGYSLESSWKGPIDISFKFGNYNCSLSYKGKEFIAFDSLDLIFASSGRTNRFILGITNADSLKKFLLMLLPSAGIAKTNICPLTLKVWGAVNCEIDFALNLNGFYNWLLDIVNVGPPFLQRHFPFLKPFRLASRAIKLLLSSPLQKLVKNLKGFLHFDGFKKIDVDISMEIDNYLSFPVFIENVNLYIELNDPDGVPFHFLLPGTPMPPKSHSILYSSRQKGQLALIPKRTGNFTLVGSYAFGKTIENMVRAFDEIIVKHRACLNILGSGRIIVPPLPGDLASEAFVLELKNEYFPLVQMVAASVFDASLVQILTNHCPVSVACNPYQTLSLSSDFGSHEEIWKVNGNGLIEGNELLLLPLKSNQFSSVFTKDRIHLSRVGWNIVFNFRILKRRLSASSSVGGFSVIFQASTNGAESLSKECFQGNCQGFMGIFPSVAVVFDIRSQNQIRLYSNGAGTPLFLSPLESVKIVDGTDHYCSLTYDAFTKQLSVFVDSLLEATFNFDFEENFALSNSEVHVGFAASNMEGLKEAVYINRFQYFISEANISQAVLLEAESEITVGEKITLTMEMRDSCGNEINSGGETLNVEFWESNPKNTTQLVVHPLEIIDSGNGNYDISVLFERPGEYEIWGEIKNEKHRFGKILARAVDFRNCTSFK